MIISNNETQNIIDDFVLTEKSRNIVKKMIPILIGWAKRGIKTKSYDNLNKELGYDKYSGIGKQLGYVDDILTKLADLTGESIPTLNSLVKSSKKGKNNGLPSYGFSYVYPSYNDMSYEEKKVFVEGLDTQAIEFNHWDWVLSKLGLSPWLIDIKQSEEIIKSGILFHNIGGEGEEHRRLKEYVCCNPNVIGLDVQGKTEQILLSGDRVDVLFVLSDDSRVAVEIKPSSASDAEMLRGLFQCIKYKKIMDSEDILHGVKKSNSVFFVVGRNLSSDNQQVCELFHIPVKIISSIYP